jgi:hypothetical protein
MKTRKPRRPSRKVIARNNPDGSRIIVSTERRPGVHPYAILIPAPAGRGRAPARHNPAGTVLGPPSLGTALQRYRADWNDVIDRTGSAFEAGRPVPLAQAKAALAGLSRQRVMLPRVELRAFDAAETGLRRALGTARVNPRVRARKPAGARKSVAARKRTVRRRAR